MNPQELTEEIVKLALELEDDGHLLAKAELEEDAVALALLKDPETKVSVAQAEKEALVTTENKYHELKYIREAKIELINAYKTRLKVFEWELKNQPI